MTTLCENKTLYYTAKHAVAVLKIRQPQVQERLYVYKCQVPDCPGYHITKLKPPEDDIVALDTMKTRAQMRMEAFMAKSEQHLRPQAGALSPDIKET